MTTSSPPLTSFEILIVIPPDGGWGWVIVAVCFFINFFIDGTTYCFGVFLDEISASLKVKPTDIAIAQSLMSGFYYFAGPLSCGLTNRYGFRVVGILGSIGSAATFYAASYLNELLPFMIVIGVLGGIFFNMIYTPCLLIVGFYFERWRALCTAISVTGTSVGITTYPIIMNNLLVSFDWRSKFRMIGGGCLVLALMLLTFRPIKPTRILREPKVGFAPVAQVITIQSSITIHDEEPSTGWTVWSFLQMIQRVLGGRDDRVSMPPDFMEYKAVGGTSIASSRKISLLGTSVRVSYDSDTSEYSNVYPINHDEERPPQGGCEKCCSKTCCYFCAEHNKYMNRPMFRDDIFYGGSVMYRLPQYSDVRYRLDMPEFGKSHIGYTMSVTRLQFESDIQKFCHWCPVAFLGVLQNMLDFSLFKSISFDMLLLSGFLTMVGTFSPYIFMTKRVTEIGLPKEWGDKLLQIIGLSNFVGRIICGVLCSLPHIDLLVVSYVTLILVGISTIASCYLTQLEYQIAFAIMFGFNSASFTALRSVVLAEIVGLEKLTNAFGIMILFYGLACFIGTPLAGMLRDQTGSYRQSFMFAGVVIFVSAVVLVPVKSIHKREKKTM